MTDLVQYIVSELLSKRLSKKDATALIRRSVNATAEGGNRSVIHPLLHSNTSDLTEQRYTSVFDGREFFLRDHQVDGRKVLPAVAYLEMVRVAVEKAMPPAMGRKSVIELRHVVWAQPVVVTRKSEVTLTLIPRDEQAGAESLHYEIHSAATDNDADLETVHSRGDVSRVEFEARGKLIIEELKARMDRGRLEAQDLYPTYEKMGVRYGATHRAISAIHRGDRELLAELRLPAAAESTFGDYLLHPSLMDAALQSPLGLVDDLNDAPQRPLLPFALDCLRILCACSKNMYAWVRYAQGGTAGDAAPVTPVFTKLDVDLCDADGNVCVEMRGLTFRELNLQSVMSEGQPTGTVYAAPVWKQELAYTVPSDPTDVLQRHIVLCGLEQVSEAEIEAGVANSRVARWRIEPHKSIAESYQELALACFEQVRRILQERSSTQVLLQLVVADTARNALLVGLSGLLRTAAIENPRLTGQILLTAPQINAQELLAQLQAEQAVLSGHIVRYSQGSREVLRLQELEVGGEPAEVAFKDDGVYLITGGLGGLGVLFAREILRTTSHATVILTGRSELGAHKREILQSLREQSGTVEYVQLDVTDAQQVRQLMQRILEEKKRLNGIIHAAGMKADNFILKKTSEEFGAVLEPKVAGTVNLDEASREIALDFLALFSSAAAVMGNTGQADYAAANGFMDQYAIYRNEQVAAGQRHGRTLSINWPLWREGGMSVDPQIAEVMRRSVGMHPMQTATGVQAFHRSLGLERARVLVVEGDTSRLRRTLFVQEAIERQTVRAANGSELVGTVAHSSSDRAASDRAVSEGTPSGGEGTPSGGGPDLQKKTQEYLKQSLSRLLKYPVSRIDAQAPLERYGVDDSIMAMNLTSEFEKTFGSLSKTLLFEYRSIAELAQYFIQSHSATLAVLFAGPGVRESQTAAVRSMPAALPSLPEPAPVPRKRRAGLAARFATSSGETERSSHREPIAIVGLSGRYPGALDVDGYWRNLRDGKDCITEVPRERWDWREYYSEDRGKEGHHYSKWGGFITRVDEFDPRFFGISPREAVFIDPQERLFLQHVWMALEDAGETRSSLQRPHENDEPGQVGVYAGVMYSEYQLFGAEALARRRRVAVPGSYASIANRVSYVLDLHGPSMTVDTMCSSSLTAIHLACQDLKLGRTDAAIAGGVNVSIHPSKYLVISAGQFISSDGHCQSFGVGGDGYIPAEGVGVVVLKRLSDALRDGNFIYGTILGSAVNHGGKTNGYSVPNPKSQAGVISRVLAESGVTARHISYIEAHGTGTKLGDPIEVAALSRAFNARTPDKGFCLIGSAKSNIGHAESAAGIAGLTKVLLQMKHREIPPSLHSSVLNPHIDFDQTPFIVNQTLRAWEQPEINGQRLPRLAGLSSFGAGGSNAHLIVQEYVPEARPAVRAVPNAGLIIPLSARTADQLKQKACDLKEFLRSAGNDTDLGAVAYTLQACREAMHVRLGLIVHSVHELIEALDAWCDGDADRHMFYQGQVKYDNDPIASLSTDPDFQETLKKWIAHGKLSNLLELWVNGLQLDWQQLYGDAKPQRISLPTYPFARDHYWIERVADEGPAAAAVTATAATPTAATATERATESVAAHATQPLAFEPVKLAAAPVVSTTAVDARMPVQLRDLDAVRALPAGNVPIQVAAPEGVVPPSTTRSVAKPAPRSGELLQQLRSSLAEALYLDPAEIDPGKPFVDLGLDSIVGVEWVKAINKQYGLNVQATRVYDYPNLRELASFLAQQLASQPETHADVKATVKQTAVPVASLQAVTLTAPQDVPPQASVAESASSESPVRSIAKPVRRSTELLQQLRSTLAEALYLDPAEIDPGKPFVDLGLDSIVGVEWVKAINKQYGLNIQATRVYDYPNLTELVGFLAQQLAAQTETPADVKATGEQTPALDAAPVAGRQVVTLTAPQDVPVLATSAPLATSPVVSPTTPAFAELPSPPARTSHATPPPSVAARGSRKIAIVGMSGRYPGASNLEQYWANLRAGKNCITEVPPSRWDVSRYYDPSPGKPGKIYCKWIGMLDDVECFDPLFFQITPAEAELMDPQHRLFLQESYRAFEDAGYSGSALSNVKCGVYMGIMSNEYALLGYGSASPNMPITGNSFAIGAARIAYFLNLKGPAIPIDTACSSSLVAVHLACQGLLNHETDMALAGGVTLYLIPESYLGMCQAGMLSADGQCKTFDDSANGFVPGEGAGALVLKRLEDAERDNDHIYGVILASGINQDGKTNGITAPSVNSQIQLERNLYSRHEIDPETIRYVETHGTGTKLGDPIELEALSTVFKERTAKRNYCALGSVKSNIGHTSAAAGVASIQKVLLSMRHATLVPTLNVNKENSLFDFAGSPFYIARKAEGWQADPNTARRAAVSSFGFSGTNAHLVIEEYPSAAQGARRSVSPNEGASQEAAIVLSARTAEQLKQKVCDLFEYLTQQSAVDLQAVAHTLQTGKDSMRERLGFVVRSTGELVEKLEAYIDRGSIDGAVQGRVRTGAQVGDEDDLSPTIGQWISTRQLDKLVKVWVEGAELDWNALYDGQPPRCVRLPTYPFAKERYWVTAEGVRAAAVEIKAPVATAAVVATEAATAAVTAARTQAAVASEAAVVFETAPETRAQRKYYRPEWQTADLVVANEISPHGPTVVVNATDELFSALREAGGTVIRVRFAETFTRQDLSTFSVNPRSEADFRELLKALEARGSLPGKVVHCASGGTSCESAGQVSDALNQGVYPLLHLCRALLTHSSLQRSVELLSVFEDHATLAAPLNAALAGFYKTLTLENPRFHGKVVGLHGELPALVQAGIILDELRASRQHETEVRYSDRNFVRQVRVLEPFAPAAADMAQMPIRHNGVYIVTGGLGGLGLIICEYLVKTFNARLVLLGRSSLQSVQREKMQRLQSYNTEVLYLQADVTSAQDVEAAVRVAKAHFSKINGVIHCAGVNRDAFILKKTAADMTQVLGPKLYGAIHLDEATRAEDLDLFVLFSSIAAVTGNIGQCDYAYGNHFLDAFAEFRRHNQRGRTLSINWPYWSEGGMPLSSDDVERMRARTGIYPLPTIEGIRCWEDLIRTDLTQALALYGNAAKIEAHFGALPLAQQHTGRAVRSTLDPEALREKTETYVKGLIGAEIKLAPERIDAQERFEAFGIDSIVINRINTRFEKDFADLPKTLLYQYETVEALAQYLAQEQGQVLRGLFGLDAESHATQAAPTASAVSAELAPGPHRFAPTEPIAVIGQHGVYPGSGNLRELWENLRRGKDLVSLVPADRWDCEALYNPDPEQAAQGKIYCKWGGFLQDVDRFDAGFFNIPPAEAAIVDPQERLFLQSVWSAFEDAGYTRERLKRQHPKAKSADVGVFVGVTTSTYQFLGATSLPWSIANRVSYFFDFQGPSMPIDTACSSSLVAVDLACESLRKGECQVAVAGGVNLYLHPSKYQSFCQRRMVSADGKTHSFGAGDAGFVPAEGVGTLVLKPLTRAVADGDRILGVIRASGYQHNGRSNGYSAPNPNSQTALISHTLAKAGLSPESISYVEGHGTGTQQGDSLEILALSNAFRKVTGAKQFCAVGSLKSNMGHAESAAGVAGLSKILLQFRHEKLTPTLHSEVPNPAIDFAASPFYLQHELTRWAPPSGHARRALISSFGSGGVAACVVLEEYRQSSRAMSTQSNGPWVFVLSAKNVDRLREYAEAMRTFIAQEEGLGLAELCYTLQTGREAMQERLAIVAADRAELLNRLSRFEASASSEGIYRNQAGPSPLGISPLGVPSLTPAGGSLAHRSVAARSLTPAGGSLAHRSVAARSLAARSADPMGQPGRPMGQPVHELPDLHELARQWTAGAKVDWERLYSHGRLAHGLGRIELPTYPFARERHWVRAASTTPEPTPRLSASHGGSLHPLIMRNSSTLREVSFSSVLSDTAYYAQEHKVNGLMLFPGSGFIEIAAAAGNMVGEGRVSRIQDVVWMQPLSLQQGPRTIQVSLKPTGDDAEYLITSYDDEYEKVVHSEGRLCFEKGWPGGLAGSSETLTAEEQIPVASLQAACVKRWDPADYYALTEQHGFLYGPAFRTLQELHVHPSYALSKLAVTQPLPADFDQYLLHPCLLDCALQTVAGLVGGLESSTPYIPFSIGEVQIIRRIPPTCYVYVERADEGLPVHADVKKFNIKVANERGAVAVRIKDFCVRSFARPPGSGHKPPAEPASARAVNHSR